MSTNKPSVAIDNPQTAEAISREQINLLRSNIPFVLLGNLVASAIVAWVNWDTSHHVFAQYWLAAVLTLVVIRGALELPAARRWVDRLSISQVTGIYVVGSGLSGLLWGLLGVVVFDANEPVTTAFYIIVLAGMTAGSLPSLSPKVLVYWAYAVPTMTPVMVHLWLTELIPAGSLMVGAYLAINMGYGRVLQKAYTETISQRFANLDLVEKLSRQKQLAEQANDAKSRFLAAASHDLRQPLFAMQLFLDALSPKLTTEQQTELLNRARQSSNNLQELLDALLDISKLDAKVIEPSITHVDTQNLLTELQKEFSPQAFAKGLELQTAECGAWCKTDPVLLARLLRNLLSNAIRYTDSGWVKVHCEEQQDHVVISICDSGVGIAKENQQLIFEEFRQLHNPQRNRSEGLGLGLAIVSRLSQLLGHQITVESNLGHGSCFKLKIQRVAASQPTIYEPAVEENLWQGQILILDNEVDVREALALICKQWQMHARTAATIEEAVALLDKQDFSPELMISDYRLAPDIDGLQAIARVRAKLPGIQAVMLTGDTDPMELTRIHDSGIPLITKPIATAKLFSQIQTLMTQR